MTNVLTIGKLAKAAGVNLETVRYYQRLGLIREPEKPPQGYRLYPPTTLSRLKFIKRAQELGFSLKEIQELLTLGDGHCKEVQSLTQHKLEQIEHRLRDLTAMQTALTTMLAQCQHSENLPNCALIDALGSGSALQQSETSRSGSPPARE